MRSTLLVGAYALLHIAAGVPKTPPTDKKSQVSASPEKDDEAERIIGGTAAQPGQFPWAAALHFNNRFICTSSIIGERTVLTAAHCVVDENGRPQRPESFHAIANVNKSSSSLRLTFERLIVHPEYRDLNNDIAIFKTAEPIAFGDGVQPVCVAASDTPLNAYQNATAMGWGNISPIRIIVIIPEVLQYVEQTVLDNAACPLLGAMFVDDTKLCATGFFNGVCNGDSGGPLVHLSADKPPVEIGITSYGNAVAGCGKISPGVFTRVSAFNDFIMQNTVGESVCTV